MKISFYNLGCKVNYAETSSLKDEFESMGFEIVEFGGETDAVIINTCTVTKAADADCRKVIRRAAREHPGAFIGVMGCYAQLRADEIVKIPGVDAVFGASEKFRIPELVRDFKKSQTPDIFVGSLSEAGFHGAATGDAESRTRAVLKIQDGCDYRCTYCTIPDARGASRGMDFSALPERIEAIMRSGFREIVLTGINLGEYHSPDGHNFTDAVRLIDSMEAGARFRISSIEPNLLNDEILGIIAGSESFCRHFHIPLQSGSDTILTLMKRRYNTSMFRGLINKIKEIMPDCGIGLDVITGFPGETDELFEEAYGFIESLPISYLHVFTYSERSGTPAAGYAGVVPAATRKKRTTGLRALSDEKNIAFIKSSIGSVQKVIPETFNERTGLWSGHTDNYIHTQFPGPAGLPAEITRVRLNGLAGKSAESELISLC